MTLGPLMVDVAGTRLDAGDRELLAHPLVGGVILFTRNHESLAQLKELVAEIHGIRSPPLLVTVDHEGGRVQRFRRDFTVLPAMRLIGHHYDMDHATGLKLARQCGWLMAAELRSVGIDMSFAPVVDLDYGVSEVIGDRSFHRDPGAVADLAVAFMGGMREAGMAAAAKHFPGHGAVIADSHVAQPVDRRPYEDMADDLYPYRRLIDNGLPAVMVSHVVYSAVDPRAAGFSPRWLQDELRQRLKFAGAIFSDDLTMQGASVAGSMAERARAALEAGCDVLPVCNNRQGVIEVVEALHNWEDPLGQIRLVRLHGLPGPSREELARSGQWQACVQAVERCKAPPELKLDA
jgi:beta-N-acetylhexosaminidase